MRALSPSRLPKVTNSPQSARSYGSQTIEVHRRTRSLQKDQHFDKYYIDPELRYRRKVENPRRRDCHDPAYIYNNLHNHIFWNWAHPLDPYRLRAPLRQRQKLNLNVLERFKASIERGEGRVPILVTEMLSQR